MNNIIPPDKQDRSILSVLCSPESLSGILNYAIDGLRSLVNSNGFSNHNAELTKQYWMKNSDPVSSFLYDEQWIEWDENSNVSKQELWNHFCAYCTVENITPITSDAYFKIMSSTYVKKGKLVSNRIKDDSGKRVYSYKGIQILDPDN